MDLLSALVLAVIQGLTEFLPISSSAHLILPAKILGWEDQGLAFDVAVHFGSLFAVMTYYRKDVFPLAYAWFASFGKAGNNERSNEAWVLFYSTIPALCIGWILNHYMDVIRSVTVIAITTVFFGVLLGAADYVSRKTSSHKSQIVSMKQGLIIGLAQCFALIPGTSRSGITMTAGLFLGLKAEVAARFSFLLSVPIITAAALYKMIELAQSELPVDWGIISLATLVSFVSAWLCIKLFIQFIEKIGFMPFVLYRLVLGGILFVYFV